MANITNRKALSDFTDANYPPIVQKIFANRGIKTTDDLDLSLSALLPISSLENVDEAANLLFSCIKAKQKIIILADYDADGATSCALAVRFLQAMGAVVDFIAPNRVKHGYGMTAAIVQEILPLKPKLIMTVDNGIANFDGVKLAKSNNCQVLITDHHLPANTLPDADVIVNPNLKSSSFASKNLAGVGVAFYVLCALHKKLLELGWYQLNLLTPAQPKDFLDLVAIGTMADVVPLDKNNRILIANGIKLIQRNKTRPGVKALFELSKCEYKHASCNDLAFYIAPRINAAGRMQDMKLGIKCLLDDNPETAFEKASELHFCNSQRRDVQQKMQQQCDDIINDIKLENLPTGICLFNSSWHEGVVGIVAGRLKEKYNRPAIVFAQATGEDEALLKGSARSISGLNIRDAFDNINKSLPLIEKFGGHAMAAGLTIKESNFTKFNQAFIAELQSQLTQEDFKQEILSDGSLSRDEFSLSFVKFLQQISPWGQEFLQPMFANYFFVLDARIVGEKHLKMIVRPDFKKWQDNNKIEIDAIAFNTIIENIATSNKPILMAYRLDINRWQGRENLQLIIEHIEA